MNQRKTKTIIVDREAYFFLDRKQRQERGGRPRRHARWKMVAVECRHSEKDVV